VYSVFVVIIFADLVLVLNKWYQSTFLGNYFLFLQIFFFGEEKRGPRHSNFKKKNQLKRSPGSEVMSILSSTVF
jgi:hypothetical protein